jgi:hypothetical protein
MTMPEDLSAETRSFLDRFDASSTDPTIPVEELFSDPFLAMDPTSVHALSPAVLANALPARREMFARAGVKSVLRRAASELRVDDFHRLVTVEWTADRGGAAPLALKSTFLLRRQDGRTRIVVYLNHVDVRALLAAAIGGQNDVAVDSPPKEVTMP